MVVTVLHFGGNGHAAARLGSARDALARRPDAPALVDVPYPGFEGRPAPPSFEAFLDAVEAFARGFEESGARTLGYASGVGALVALGLRARGRLERVPLVFQGPVLWGLRDRAFPRWMRRVPPVRGLLQRLFATARFQEHFVHKHFRRPVPPATRAGFFDGYARCAAFGLLFGWLSPAWLDGLRAQFAGHPGRLGGVTVWLGGRDTVVGPAEVEATARALGVAWPLVTFPDWGHYPQIDEPEEWADALCRYALATA